MRKIRSLVAAAVICAALWLATTAAAGGPPDIRRWVTAGGGGQFASQGLVLRGTAGQSSAGVFSSTGATLCAGFWCTGLPGANLYLPLVLRQ